MEVEWAIHRRPGYLFQEFSKNKAYEEKYCHTCGNEHAASFGKPVCPACYRKYKDMFVFATS